MGVQGCELPPVYTWAENVAIYLFDNRIWQIRSCYSCFYHFQISTVIGVARGGERGHAIPQIFRKYTHIVLWDAFSKQNSVFWPPQIFALATLLIAIAVSTIEGHSYFSTLSFYLFRWSDLSYSWSCSCRSVVLALILRLLGSPWFIFMQNKSFLWIFSQYCRVVKTYKPIWLYRTHNDMYVDHTP